MWLDKRKVAILSGSLLCLLIIIQFFRGSILSNASEAADSEVVILVDNSQSVQVVQESIKEWITKFGVYVQDTDVVIQLKIFDDIDKVENLYDGKIIDESDGEIIDESDGQDEQFTFTNYKEAIEKINFDKDWTDQAGAMERAVEDISGSKAKKKCIVMLSDATLDYERDEKQKKGVERFINAVDAFAGKDNQEVILVEFISEQIEENDEDEIKNIKHIYEGCKEAKVFSQHELTEEIIQIILGETGIKDEREIAVVKDNQITFKSEKDYYRMIFEIESNDDIKLEDINNICIEKGGSPIEKEFYTLLGNCCYLYFNNLEEGSYVINVPDSSWTYKIIKQSKLIVDNIELWVEQNESKIEPIYNNQYNIQGDSFKLIINIKAWSSYPNSELKYLDIKYGIVPKESDVQTEYGDISAANEAANKINNNENDNGKFEQVIHIADYEGMYECFVTVSQEGIECARESIFLSITKGSGKEDEVEILPGAEVKVGKSVNLEDVFGNFEDDGDYKLLINEVEVRVEGKYSDNNCQYEDKELKFVAAGKYDISLWRDGDEEQRICYVVKEKYFFKIIKKWFAENFTIGNRVLFMK